MSQKNTECDKAMGTSSR